MIPRQWTVLTSVALVHRSKFSSCQRRVQVDRYLLGRNAENERKGQVEALESLSTRGVHRRCQVKMGYVEEDKALMHIHAFA